MRKKQTRFSGRVMFLRALKPSAPSSPGRAATPLTLPTNQRNQRVATLLKAVTEARWNPLATFSSHVAVLWAVAEFYPLQEPDQ